MPKFGICGLSGSVMSFCTLIAGVNASFGFSRIGTIGGVIGSFIRGGSLPLMGSTMSCEPPPPPPPAGVASLGAFRMSLTSMLVSVHRRLRHGVYNRSARARSPAPGFQD